MSHSSHYGSFTIHCSGDYSGPFSINNSIRYISGEDKSKDIIKNEYGSPTYISIKYNGGFNGLVRLTKKAIFNHQKQLKISGVDEDSNKRKSFLVNTDDVLDFIIQKEKFQTICKIENMDSMTFFKKFMGLSKMNWSIGCGYPPIVITKNES
jgi:hypothetical protein